MIGLESIKDIHMIHCVCPNRTQQWLTAMCLPFSAPSEGRIRNLGLGSKIGTFLGPFWHFGPIWDKVPNSGPYRSACLHIEGMACMTNPKSEFRKSQIPTVPSPSYSSAALEESISNLDQPESETPFSCPLCKDGFETEPWLKRHMNQKHPETDPKNPRQCPMCEKTLCNEQRLKCHIKTMHLTCKCCKLECVSQDELVLHIQVEHSKPCVCPTCDKVLTTE